MDTEKLSILGVMSGTSLDGIDLALCDFFTDDGNLHFTITKAVTIPYNQHWKSKLSEAFNAGAIEFFELHALYGKFIAQEINTFLKDIALNAKYVASHGHTVFHRPDLNFTTQIGCGATIAALTGIDTICDFRSVDVALNGQGAPLVPVGDRDLFGQYGSCLNIGGIANISFTKNKVTTAFDICIANMALNYLSEELGKNFDMGGKIAATGTIHHQMLRELLCLNAEKKSLGREYFIEFFLPIILKYKLRAEHALATCVEYIALEISKILNSNNLKSVLITGGGAFNTHLTTRLQTHFNGSITIPDKEIVEFKEALIFAYLGYLRINEQFNTFKNVTHATRNSCGGCVYKGVLANFSSSKLGFV